MKTSHAILFILGGVLMASSPVGAQEQLYTGEDGVELYDAPNADANIVSTLAKGVALQVLETADSGYTRVRTPDNWEGWVSSQLLVAEPPATTETQTMQPPPTAVEPKKSGTATKAAEPATATSEPPASKSAADSVQTQLAAAQQELQAAREVNRRLKDETSLKWFLSGAGVLLLGFLIGLIVPKVQWRRKSWHSY